jgi:ATP-dependent helicase YprA (DUF1998 family)
MAASHELGIEDSELEGGFRTRSADVINDESSLGIVEIFLFDTTPGGAGFSSKVWDEFDSVVSRAQKVLTGEVCDCDSACHKCLRRYGNRHLHGQLDRFLGAALLEYGLTGETPDIASNRVESLVRRLEQSLTLQDPTVELQQRSGRTDGWTVTADQGSFDFSVRSCLQRPREQGDVDRDFSDHQLQHKLPEVATEIIHSLE